MHREINGHLAVSICLLCTMMALLAVFDQAWEQMYAWLGISMLLRAAEAEFEIGFESELASSSESAHLEAMNSTVSRKIIDFLTNAFVPIIGMLHAGFLDGPAGVAIAGVALMSALYRFAFTKWDLSNNTFIGFPVAWGVLGFYFHAFDATPLAAVFVIGGAIVLGVVSGRWPHPLHTLRWATLNRFATLVWTIAAGLTVIFGFPASVQLKGLLIAIAVYGAVLTAALATAQSIDTPPTDMN